MGTEPEPKAFLRTWRDAISEAAPNRRPIAHGFWEGKKAYNEIQRAGLLDRIILTEKNRSYIAEHAIPDFCAELLAYKKNLKRVTTVIQRTKDICEWLTQVSRACRKRCERTQDIPDISKLLAKCAREIEGTRRLIIRKEQERWSYPSGMVGELYSDLAGRRTPWQERMLDSRFQVRIAIVFLKYLPRDRDQMLSLSTIARLVVLFCYCAKLGNVRDTAKGERLFLTHGGHEVSVKSVLRKLRSNRINQLLATSASA